jgi:hypothetical protein
MPETPEQAASEFHFPGEFADCVAKVAANWSALEYMINATIWELAEVRPSLGACLTAQIGTVQARLSALLALMKLRRVDTKLLKKVNRFAERVRGPNELRNRIIHDQWVNDRINPEQMGRIEIVAPKALTMEIKPITIEALREDLEKISECRFEFGALRNEIRGVLPTLPRMSQRELTPIIENLPAPQTPASEQT